MSMVVRLRCAAFDQHTRASLRIDAVIVVEPARQGAHSPSPKRRASAELRARARFGMDETSRSRQ